VQAGCDGDGHQDRVAQQHHARVPVATQQELAPRVWRAAAALWAICLTVMLLARR
jgi:hypothetical protein